MSRENVNSDNPAAGQQSSQELADRISQAAQQGRLAEAESLRQEMMRVDPMNLKLIITAGEIIEEQKTKLLDRDHLAAWQDLYGDLSEEEINGLFYSLHPAVVESNKLLQVQGKISNRLFLIDNGKVVLFYRKDEKNKVVAQLGRGDIVGETSFFEISLCPLSAATQSEVKLYSLSRSAAETWQEQYPGLFERLAEFCRRAGKSAEAIAQKNLDRRSTARYPVSGAVTAVIVDKNGNPTDTFVKGGMSDISQTGLCFDIKCSKQETARSLLAATINLSLAFDAGSRQPFTIQGLITKVSFHLHNDYSVHVKFKNTIGDETFRSFPCRWSEGGETSDEKPQTNG